jgi:hypothetical protein
VPLTEFQQGVAQLLASQRTPDSHLAGGAAMHLQPQSLRYSNDLDYFHDSEERVASAFAADRALLESQQYKLDIRLNQPGFIRAIVARGDAATKVEWAHDTAWRFMPAQKDATAGYILHPVDLAVNKLLALVGRDEPRDFLDILYVHESVLALGAVCWAAAGKDPGFTPATLLDLLRRRGRFRGEDFARLRLREAPDLPAMKQTWLSALQSAQIFVDSRPPSEAGCLYYSHTHNTFVSQVGADVAPHYGRPGGIVPLISS